MLSLISWQNVSSIGLFKSFYIELYQKEVSVAQIYTAEVKNKHHPVTPKPHGTIDFQFVQQCEHRLMIRPAKLMSPQNSITLYNDLLLCVQQSLSLSCVSMLVS